MPKLLSERELKLYRFYLESIVNKTTIPPFKIITRIVFSDGNHQFKENSGEASRVTSYLVDKGLIQNTKDRPRASITILPLTTETKEIVPDDLQALVEQAIKMQISPIHNGSSYQRILAHAPKTNTHGKRKSSDSTSNELALPTEKENVNPVHQSKKAKLSGEATTPSMQKISYETYCSDIRSQLKSSSLASFKMALLSFYDLYMLKKLDPQVDFPRRFLPKLDGNDVFHGFEWLDLALKYGDKSAKDYFREILRARAPLMVLLKDYYQKIKQQAQANIEFTGCIKHLFAEETEYYKDNESEATYDY